MEKFCNSCGIEFTNDMCSWEGGAQQEHFKKWVGFHVSSTLSFHVSKSSVPSWPGKELTFCHLFVYIKFQDDAEKSNGIAKPAGSDDEVKAKEEKKAKEVEQMPQIVKDAIKDNMVEYQYLREKSTAVSS